MDAERIDWFWDKVDFQAPNGCWEWKGALSKAGYGIFKTDTRTSRAHRVAFELKHGRQPAKNVLHKCDNKACVNPDHLIEGTQRENIEHWKTRGKSTVQRPARWPANMQRIGTSNGQSKLDDDKVRQILSSPKSQAALGREFKVSKTLVRMILNGEAWSHVQ